MCQLYTSPLNDSRIKWHLGKKKKQFKKIQKTDVIASFQDGLQWFLPPGIQQSLHTE